MNLFLHQIWRNAALHHNNPHHSRPSINSGVDYLWIIVMFLSAVWTLILTAPIHCRGSICEQVMECYISPNLIKKQAHLHLGWPESEDIFGQFWIFGWTALILYNQSLEFTSLIRVSSQLPNELLSLNCTLPLQLLADPIIHKRLVSSKDISGKLSAVSFKIGTWYLTLPSVWPLLSPVA